MCQGYHSAAAPRITDSVLPLGSGSSVGAGHGHSASALDQGVGVLRSSPVKEGLSGVGQGLVGTGGKHEGTLNGVGAVQNGLLRGSHAAHGQNGDALLVLDSGQRGVPE